MRRVRARARIRQRPSAVQKRHVGGIFRRFSARTRVAREKIGRVEIFERRAITGDAGGDAARTNDARGRDDGGVVRGAAERRTARRGRRRGCERHGADIRYRE